MNTATEMTLEQLEALAAQKRAEAQENARRAYHEQTMELHRTEELAREQRRAREVWEGIPPTVRAVWLLTREMRASEKHDRAEEWERFVGLLIIEAGRAIHITDHDKTLINRHIFKEEE